LGKVGLKNPSEAATLSNSRVFRTTVRHTENLWKYVPTQLSIWSSSSSQRGL